MRRNDVVSDAFFWKHLADTLLENAGINKELFYQRIKPVKSIWDIRDLDKMSLDIKKAAQNKTQFIKENFAKIISESKNNK
jgi:hypothetical protein